MKDTESTATTPADWVRRAAMISPALLAAGCVDLPGTSSDVLPQPDSIKILKKADWPHKSDVAMPQFLFGSNRAPRFIQVAFSLHCGGSREWFLKNFPNLIQACKAGQTQVMFSHLARTPQEIEAGVEVLSVGPDQYVDAMTAVIAFTLYEQRALSAAEIKAYLPAAGYPPAPQADRATLAVAMTMIRAVYQKMGATGTPFIKEIRRA